MSSSSASTRVKSLEELYARESLDRSQVVRAAMWVKRGEPSIDVTDSYCSPKKMRERGYTLDLRTYMTTDDLVTLDGCIADLCDLALPPFDPTDALENLANGTITIMSRNSTRFSAKHHRYFKACRNDLMQRWKRCCSDARRCAIILKSDLDYYYTQYTHAYGDYSPDAAIPRGEDADYNAWRKLLYLTVKDVVAKMWIRSKDSGEDFCIGTKAAVFADLDDWGDGERPESDVPNVGHTADIVTEWVRSESYEGDCWTVVRTDLHVSTDKRELVFTERDFNAAGTVDLLAVRRCDLSKFERGQKCGVRLVVIQTALRKMDETAYLAADVLSGDHTPFSWWSCYLSICKGILEARTGLRVDSMVIVNANNARSPRSDCLQVLKAVDMTDCIGDLLLPLDDRATEYRNSPELNVYDATSSSSSSTNSETTVDSSMRLRSRDGARQPDSDRAKLLRLIGDASDTVVKMIRMHAELIAGNASHPVDNSARTRQRFIASDDDDCGPLHSDADYVSGEPSDDGTDSTSVDTVRRPIKRASAKVRGAKRDSNKKRRN